MPLSERQILNNYYRMDNQFKIMVRVILAEIITSMLLGCNQVAIMAEATETEMIVLTKTLIPTAKTLTSTTEKPILIPTLVSDFTDEHGVEMKLIPAGEFQMGTDKAIRNDETPIHTVYLDAFYMDVYEITNALYTECEEEGICVRPIKSDSHSRNSYYGNPAFSNYPVTFVSWDKAKTFCEWRGARLPTEAEWEKAARGGLEGKHYPWGDEEPVCRKGEINGAKFYDPGGYDNAGCKWTDTEPVGSYAPNDYGLYDMAGNLEEWVWDWYSEDYYDQSPPNNPVGPDSGSFRVLRGGSWGRNSNFLRVVNRSSLSPDWSSDGLTFRCARAPLSPSSLPSKPTDQVTSTPTDDTAIEADYYDEHCVAMNLIPPGEFQMGSESGKDNENPVHTVYLDAFYMDVYEVTNAKYAECVEDGICSEIIYWKYQTGASCCGNSTEEDYPVVNVSWRQAGEFCEWRGARLPTEAEWERAARGGLEGYDYPWGNQYPVCQKGAANGAKFDDNAGCKESNTEPVGSYAPNGFGLFDIAGNVWEWVQDRYSSDYYGLSLLRNPFGPYSGIFRVLRGGSWNNGSDDLRVANRVVAYPYNYNIVTGFRCSRSVGR